MFTFYVACSRLFGRSFYFQDRPTKKRIYRLLKADGHHNHIRNIGYFLRLEDFEITKIQLSNNGINVKKN